MGAHRAVAANGAQGTPGQGLQEASAPALDISQIVTAPETLEASQAALTPPTLPLEPPLELSTYGWVKYFSSAESAAFMQELRSRAPGVHFNLGDARVGLNGEHLLLEHLGARTSIELTGLKAGDSVEVGDFLDPARGTPAAHIVVSRYEGTALHLKGGAMRIADATFLYDPQSIESTLGAPPPRYPITVTPGEKGAAVAILFDELQGGRSRYTCAAFNAPSGATITGVLQDAHFLITDEGSCVIDTDGADGASGRAALHRARVDINTGPSKIARCRVETVDDRPFVVDISPVENPLTVVLEPDPQRSYLSQRSPGEIDVGLRHDKISFSAEFDPNYDPSDSVIGLCYAPVVAVSRSNGDFCISPALRNAPLTITRTGDAARPDITFHSRGNLHGVVRGEELLLFPPRADPTRAGESLGRVSVTDHRHRSSVEVPLELDQNGSLDSFGARPATISSNGGVERSSWGAHWWSAAATLHDAGLKPALLDETTYRERSEAVLTKLYPEVLKATVAAIDDTLPRNIEIETKTGSFVIAGFGPKDRGYLSVERGGATTSLYAENIAGPLMDRVAQELWSTGEKAKEAGKILARADSIGPMSHETERELRAAGLSNDEIALLNSEAVGILTHPAVREALSAIPFEFNLETKSIEITRCNLDLETDAAGLRSFRGTLELKGIEVSGALPFGEVGNVAGAIIGAPGALYDLGEGLDKATQNNPLVAPLTIPAKVVGGIFKGGELATKAIGGDIDIKVRVDISGTKTPSGEWIISHDPVKVAAQ